MERGAWWATVQWVVKRHKWLTFLSILWDINCDFLFMHLSLLTALLKKKWILKLKPYRNAIRIRNNVCKVPVSLINEGCYDGCHQNCIFTVTNGKWKQYYWHLSLDNCSSRTSRDHLPTWRGWWGGLIVALRQSFSMATKTDKQNQEEWRSLPSKKSGRRSVLGEKDLKQRSSGEKCAWHVPRKRGHCEQIGSQFMSI